MTKYVKYYIAFLLIFSVNINHLHSQDTLIISREDITPSVGLYLSGGGARGIVQVGVLSEIEKSGLSIDYIAGTSMGAIIGGLYSSGYTAEDLHQLALVTDWSSASEVLPQYDRNSMTIDQKYIKDQSFFSFKFNNFRIQAHEGISQGKEYYNILQHHYYSAPFKSDSDYDKLFIPFRATTTELTHGDTKYFDKGNIINVVRASGSFPLKYTPIKMDSSIYIDGGMFANIPSDAQFDNTPDIKIGIDNTSPIYEYEDINTSLIIADQAMSLWMKYFEKINAEKLDLVLKPDLGKWNITDFSKIDSLIDLGRKSYKENEKEITKKYKEKSYKKTLLFLDSNYTKIPAEYEDIIASKLFELFKDENIDKVKLHTLANGKFECEPIYYDTIKAVSLVDNSVIDTLKLQYFNKRYHNKPFNEKTMKCLTRDIIDTYIEKEYSFASLDYYSIKNGVVEISINPALINSISISGNGEVAEYLVKREIEIKVGEIATSSNFIDTWNNLYNCGLFTDIVIDYSYNYYGSIDVEISLSPVGNQELNVGMSYDDERNFKIDLQFNHFNLFNSGTNINLGVMSGEYDHKAELLIFNNRIGSQDLGLSLQGYWENRDCPSYTPDTLYPNSFYKYKRRDNMVEQRLGLTALINSSLYKSGRVSFGMRQDFLRTFVNGEFRNDWHSVNLIHASLNYDSEDKVAFADKGYKIDLLFETNFLETGRHISFTKIYMAARANFGAHNFIFTPSAKIGAGDKTMPREEMFRLGGIDSFYGLELDRLIGRQIFYTSLEAKYLLPVKLFFDTYITVRYDYGNSWDVTRDFNFDSMYNGIGGALALDTPIGPAKLAIGKSFTSKDVNGFLEEGPLVLYFYIGMKL